MATSKDFRVKNGLVVEQDISFGGSFKDLSGNPISLGGTSSDTYTVKDSLILQQSETPIGTVVSKTSIPSSSSPVTYTGGSPSQISTALSFDYGYFYSTYANIYSSASNTAAFQAFFANGKTITIQKNGYTWELTINNYLDYGSWAQIYYTVNSTNSPWMDPASYDPYYQTAQSGISFSGVVVTPEQYILTLSGATTPLTADDKLILNGSQVAAPTQFSVPSIGTWDISINGGNPSTNVYTVDFGSNNYNSNQAPIRKLLQVGTLVTIADNTWGESGVYLVTAVGPDGTWASTNGMRVTFEYVSGTNYPTSYAGLSTIFQSYFAGASGIIIPNYTTEYIDDFAIAVGSTYKSFNQYSYLNIGDVISHIPATTSIKFKDDAGNNIKAITYNNSTNEMTYDGIVQPILTDAKSNLYSLNSNPLSTAYTNIVTLGNSTYSQGNASVCIGFNSLSGESGISIGHTAQASSIYSVAIGQSTNASTFGIAIGWASATSSGISIGSSAQSSSGIALFGNAYGARAINMGAFSSANQNSQISISTSISGTYPNQTSTVFWSDGNLTKNGITYLRAANGQSNSTQSSTNTSSEYTVDIGNRFERSARMMMLGTATILIKPTGDLNNDDTKAVEIKLVVRSTANNTFVLETISTNNIFAGTGSIHPNWTPSFELFNNRYLHFKLDKGSDTTVLGVVCKLEFQVLHTA